MSEENRFSTFSEHERATMALGLTLLVLEMLDGPMTGQPMPAEMQARDFPIIVNLVNEMSGSFGMEGLDSDVTSLITAILDQEAAAARDA